MMGLEMKGKMRKISAKQGFTIIEVVLVLAIAGLIFLMVFVALPTLQRSQRDAQRKQDMARVVTAITNWQANNGNSLPNVSECSVDINSSSRSANVKPNTPSTYANNDACTLIAKYLNDRASETNEFKDPDGTAYGIVIPKRNKVPSDFNHTASINKGYKCSNDSNVIEQTKRPNDFAVLYMLEESGIMCTDNQ